MNVVEVISYTLIYFHPTLIGGAANIHLQLATVRLAAAAVVCDVFYIRVTSGNKSELNLQLLATLVVMQSMPLEAHLS